MYSLKSLKNKAKQKVVNFFIPLVRSLFPNLLKFREHLQTKLSKRSHILKNNPIFNCKFEFFMEQLRNAQGALVFWVVLPCAIIWQFNTVVSTVISGVLFAHFCIVDHLLQNQAFFFMWTSHSGKSSFFWSSMIYTSSLISTMYINQCLYYLTAHRCS